MNIHYEIFSGDIPCEAGILNLSSHDWLLEKTLSMMTMMTMMIPKKKLNFPFVSFADGQMRLIELTEHSVILKLY
jgi:hypothetical protein